MSSLVLFVFPDVTKRLYSLLFRIRRFYFREGINCGSHNAEEFAKLNNMKHTATTFTDWSFIEPWRCMTYLYLNLKSAIFQQALLITHYQAATSHWQRRGLIEPMAAISKRQPYLYLGRTWRYDVLVGECRCDVKPLQDLLYLRWPRHLSTTSDTLIGRWRAAWVISGLGWPDRKCVKGLERLGKGLTSYYLLPRPTRQRAAHLNAAFPYHNSMDLKLLHILNKI